MEFYPVAVHLAVFNHGWWFSAAQLFRISLDTKQLELA
jgi:hypothetical protein